MVNGVCVFKPKDGLIEEGGSVGWTTVVVRKPGTVLDMFPIISFIFIHFIDVRFVFIWFYFHVVLFSFGYIRQVYINQPRYQIKITLLMRLGLAVVEPVENAQSLRWAFRGVSDVFGGSLVVQRGCDGKMYRE